MTTGADREEVTRWIAERAHRLPLADLEPLGERVRHAAVVGLAGSMRGAHELSALAHRILRFLVEHAGFRALVLEERWTRGLQLDEYVRTGPGDPRALLADAWPPLRTEETAPEQLGRCYPMVAARSRVCNRAVARCR